MPILSFLSELLQVIGLGLAMLLPLANPITTVALLLGLSKGMNREEIHHEARMASIYVFIIMCVAYYAGQFVMHSFGISIPGLRIAGGLIVAFIGFKMLFPTQEDAGELKDITQSDIRKNDKQSIAFIPLAMPSTAGPGTIAMIISSASSTAQTNFSHAVVAVAPVCIFLSISLILWSCLRSAHTIMKWLGKTGVEAISRLMGFFLICMGVQFIINGVSELIRTFA